VGRECALARRADSAWPVSRYTCDALGNQVGAHVGEDSLLYLVNGMNRRVARILDGGRTHTRLYQNQINVIAELDDAGAPIVRYACGTRAHVPDLAVKNGVTYRLVTDQFGSVTAAVNVATGQVVQRMNYDAWGNLATDTNPDFQSLGYAGGIMDRATGLIRFGARDYDPYLGRWSAKDPIGLRAAGMNLYEYVETDPVNLTDPTGLRPLTECEKEHLRPYIPKRDLKDARVHEGVVPWWLGSDMRAVTLGDDIYIRSGQYDPQSSGGIALLGHELVHVVQFRIGMTIPSYLLGSVLGYDRNRYERPAVGTQDQIQKDLDKRGDKGCNCP
jgi:RHS repeat-associated protein